MVRVNGRSRLEHFVVAEQMFGRPLAAAERVHHRNGIRHDNRPENLELWVRGHPPGQRLEDLARWLARDHREALWLAVRKVASTPPRT